MVPMRPAELPIAYLMRLMNDPNVSDERRDRIALALLAIQAECTDEGWQRLLDGAAHGWAAAPSDCDMGKPMR